MASFQAYLEEENINLILTILYVIFECTALSYSDSTAVDGSDYVGVYSAEIPTYSGMNSQFFFQITVIDDNIVEDNEIFGVVLIDAEASGVTRTDMVVITSNAEDQSTTLTIMDDDSATLTVVSADVCANEGDTTAEITLQLDKAVQDEGFSFSKFIISVVNSHGIQNRHECTEVKTKGPGKPGKEHSKPSFATLSLGGKVTVSEGDQSAEITVFLSNPIEDSTGFSAGFTYSDIGAVAPDDYTASPTTLAIPQNPTTELTVTVDLTDDSIVEDDESFIIQLASLSDPLTSNSMRIGVPDTAAICIIDEDTATIALDFSGTVTEMDTTVTLTVDITGDTIVDTGFSATLGYGGSSADGSDFTSVAEVLIPPSTSSTEVEIVIIADDIVEDNELIVVDISSVGHMPFTHRTAGAVIVHPTPSMVTQTKIQLPVYFTDISLFQISAEEDDDYGTTVTSFSVDPMSLSTTMTIAIPGDSILEDNELFGLVLVGTTNPGSFIRATPGIQLSTPVSSTVTITDDDFATCSFNPSGYCVDENSISVDVTFDCDIPVEDTGFSFATCMINNNPSTTEGIGVSVGVQVVCSNEVDQSGFSIDVSFLDDTAFDTSDFDGTATTSLDITPSQTTFTFNVPILNDMIVEDVEEFFAVLGTVNFPGGFTRTDAVTIEDVTGTIAINDDDSTTCSMVDAEVCTDEGTGIEISFECTNAVQDDGFQVSFDITDGTATSDDDYTSTIDSADLATSTTTFGFFVEILQDSLVEDTHSFTVTLTGASSPGGFTRGDAISIVTSSTTISIKDDDTDISYSDKDTEGSSDYTATQTLVSIPTTQTSFSFSVEVVNDDVVEDFESFCLNLNDVLLPSTFVRTDGAEAVPSTATVTVNDDDTALCQVDQTPVCATEGVDSHASVTITCDKVIVESGVMIGETALISITIRVADILGMLVDLAYRDRTAFNPEDYFATVTTALIPTGSVALPLLVPLNDDMEVEDDESFEVILVAVSETGTFVRNDVVRLGNDFSGSVTIKDTDSDLSYVDGSAGSPEDYTSVQNVLDLTTSVTSLSFSVSIMHDNFVENDEFFTINVDNVNFPAGAGANDVNFVGSQIVQIEDDDTDLTFTDGTALDGSDYTTTDSSFDFLTSTTALSFSFSILDDSTIEDDETFFITVSNIGFPGGFVNTDGVVWEGTQTVTIRDEDAVMETTEVVETTEAPTKFDPTTEGREVTTDESITTEQPEATTSADDQAGERNLGPDVDPCLTGNACPDSNMECSSSNGTVSCLCTNGYTLDDLDPDICRDINECLTSVCDGFLLKNCINTRGSYLCVCQEGFTGTSEGGCQDVDECQQSPCQQNQYCLNLEGSFQCSCQEGFRKTVDGLCKDVDECQQSPCQQGQYCLNLEGSFQCACQEGFRETVDGLCEDINECEDGSSLCSTFENTECVNTYGNYTCSCIEGYFQSFSGICLPAAECTPEMKEKCHFPEDLCMVNDVGESFCACSPGFRRSNPFLPCENKNECQEFPNICGPIANSHCVDEVPTETNPDQVYTCSCNDGFVELVTGKCVEEVIFRLSALVLTVNAEAGSSIWSPDLNNKNSARFGQFSEFFCSLFQGAVLTAQEVNRTTCSGIGFAVEDTSIKVALELRVLSAHFSLSSDFIKSSILTSTSNVNGVRIFEKSNGDTISVQDGSIDVQLLKDIVCYDSLCKNGGRCIMDERLYEISCQCTDGFVGMYCDEDASTISGHDGTSRNVGLFIGLAFASFVIFFVMIGLCWMLLRSNKEAFKATHKAAYNRTPVRLTAHPFITRGPEVVRNPLTRPSTDDEASYDEKRMKNLEQTFMRMTVLESARLSANDGVEDDTPSSAGFSVPYGVDGSVNV
ncbi:Hemicentin-1 [Holothuria leucospilota]|uniref:Hemicentin-1 n=1 Tax=Holothuria leucospilota TaxID=206669 RepID=A0A9Q0YJ41_HOLLE|nr:Hemicentin-1 [Holothuria leucospilota]